MRQLTKADALILMASHWQLLADFPELDKEESLGNTKIDNDCYACEYNVQQGSNKNCGTSCIVDWGCGEWGCQHPDSLYEKWDRTYDHLTKSKLAQKISLLCEKALTKLYKEEQV